MCNGGCVVWRMCVWWCVCGGENVCITVCVVGECMCGGVCVVDECM